MTEVVAALIWEGETFLICQRPAHKARGLLWEFVGGKVEPGETREEALVRECREELDIRVAVGEPFMEVIHAYPDLTVHLTLFHASIAEGTPRKLEHQDIRWIRAGASTTLSYPAASPTGSGRQRSRSIDSAPQTRPSWSGCGKWPDAAVPHRLEDKTRPAPEWRWP